MVVGALRAVTAARLEMMWNALTKGSIRASRAPAAVIEKEKTRLAETRNPIVRLNLNQQVAIK